MKKLIALFAMIAMPLMAADQIETLQYEILEQEGNFEIREYQPYVAASVLYDTRKGENTNTAFMKLFRYISGANDGGTEIPMTAPVTMEGVEINMTSPVLNTPTDNAFVKKMSFMVPSKYDFATTPKPTNPEVFIEQIPERIIAAHTFSWFAGETRRATKALELRTWLNDKNYNVISDSFYAGYDAPMTLPHQRRHEMMFLLESK